jgi:hypothetical protein
MWNNKCGNYGEKFIYALKHGCHSYKKTYVGSSVLREDPRYRTSSKSVSRNVEIRVEVLLRYYVSFVDFS